jgi:hypothetical protein
MASRIITYQSLPYTWAASTTLPFDLSFLNPARSMLAPVIWGVRLRFSGTAATGSSGGPARIFPQLYTQIQLADIAGDRVNVRGSSLRVIDQIEYGAGYSDCTPTTTITSNATSTTALEFWLRLPFRPMRAQRRDDFGLPLREFLDGGKLQVVTAAANWATNFITTSNGTITAYVDVVDEGVPEAKSRLCWIDQNISKTEDQYNIAGLGRYVVAYAGEVLEQVSTKLPTAWSSQTVTSKTLELSQVQDTYFYDYYKQESTPRIADPGIPATASVVVPEDSVVNGLALPFLMADNDEATPSLPQMATVHYKTSLSSITTGNLPQMISSVVTERSDAATARTLGADWRQRLGKGYVAAADGNHKPIGAFAPGIQKFLPLRIAR